MNNSTYCVLDEAQGLVVNVAITALEHRLLGYGDNTKDLTNATTKFLWRETAVRLDLNLTVSWVVCKWISRRSY